ncbi:MAG: hypothetical protein ABFS02_14360 [Pseudomonadota bacterium]
MLKQYGVARMVGVDIIPEAMEAQQRDRPAVYDDYYVADFTQLESIRRTVQSQNGCMTRALW